MSASADTTTAADRELVLTRLIDAPREHIATGILWMLAVMFCFIALDAVMRYLLQFHSLV
jgi:TRAP-type mannitol/chloroaromatic compound transport system permease small subunit